MSCTSFHLDRRERLSAYLAFAILGIGVGLGVVLGVVITIDADPAVFVLTIIATFSSFIIAMMISRLARGREVSVASEQLLAAVGGTAGAAYLWSMPVLAAIDLAAIGIGVLLVFGRLGCTHAACCYGRPARRGLVYGARHVAAGFPRALAGVPLFPLQLVESVAHVAIVVAAVVVATRAPAGHAAATYLVLYSVVRVVSETRRGDHVRPYLLGVSETQWLSLATMLVIALVTRGHLLVIGALAASAGFIAVTRWTSVVSAVLIHDVASALFELPPTTTAVASVRKGQLVVSRSLEETAVHYALSRAGSPMSRREVAALTTLIARITGQEGEPTITEGQRPGITHLRFG